MAQPKANTCFSLSLRRNAQRTDDLGQRQGQHRNFHRGQMPCADLHCEGESSNAPCAYPRPDARLSGGILIANKASLAGTRLPLCLPLATPAKILADQGHES